MRTPPSLAAHLSWRRSGLYDPERLRLPVLGVPHTYRLRGEKDKACEIAIPLVEPLDDGLVFGSSKIVPESAVLSPLVLQMLPYQVSDQMQAAHLDIFGFDQSFRRLAEIASFESPHPVVSASLSFRTYDGGLEIDVAGVDCMTVPVSSGDGEEVRALVNTVLRREQPTRSCHQSACSRKGLQLCREACLPCHNRRLRT